MPSNKISCKNFQRQREPQLNYAGKEAEEKAGECFLLIKAQKRYFDFWNSLCHMAKNVQLFLSPTPLSPGSKKRKPCAGWWKAKARDITLGSSNKIWYYIWGEGVVKILGEGGNPFRGSNCLLGNSIKISNSTFAPGSCTKGNVASSAWPSASPLAQDVLDQSISEAKLHPP